MKPTLFSILLLLLVTATLPVSAQKTRKLAADSTITTTGEVTVKGKRFPYTVVTGTQPVWDEDGKAIAALEYTYYERTDITNKATRPLVISFNGGPGSARARARSAARPPGNSRGSGR